MMAIALNLSRVSRARVRARKWQTRGERHQNAVG
jgi:hypothetical protein